MRLFAHSYLSDHLEAKWQAAQKEIERENSNYLLNTNETMYIEYIVSKHVIEPPILDYDGLSASQSEKMIRAEAFPFTFNVYSGKSYPRQVVTIHIPFTGDVSILAYIPSRFSPWSYEVAVGKSDLSFDIVNFSDDGAQIKREVDSIISHIRGMADSVKADVENFNDKLPERVGQQVRSRKATLQKQLGVLGQLGIPIRKAENVPSTFAVPTPPKQVKIKPPAPSTAFTPEPALDDTTYKQILSVIYDLGREMERHPDVTEGKGEEAIRDLFLLQLAPHFQSVSGETFNKKGKTDILVRHEGHNVFVAECKIWKGAGEFTKAIDQLLSYLTWRDSKTALMVFVRNKEFQPVLDTVNSQAQNHANFVSAKPSSRQGCFTFEFHLPSDTSRSVYMEIMCFHFV